MMIFIDNQSIDPYFNLACEEYLLENAKDDVFMLWQNRDSVIIGRNQNTLSEINYDYVKENDIAVVRRLTGGGAVFHDLDNLNFTWILKDGGEWFSNFEKFTEPVISALSKFGVKAELSGRNDILCDGRKISGNSQIKYKGKLMHHGTLLFNSDVNKLTSALNVSKEKIKAKGVKSVKSRVANINEFSDVTIEEFKNEIFNGKAVFLSDREREEINTLKEKKYSTWEWNFGYSPKYNYSDKKYLKCGLTEINMTVKDGIISDMKIYGDFFEKQPLFKLEEKINGRKHERGELLKLFCEDSPENYILGITTEEFLVLMGV